MTLYSTDSSVLESEIFWMVFDYQMGDRAQSAAIAWVSTHLLAPPCPADINLDGTVGPADLGLLLGAWGTTDFDADVNGSGLVDASDLALLLGAWNMRCSS